MSQYRIVTVPDMQPDEWHFVERGTRLRESMPRTNGPVVLRLNDAYLLRKDWPELVSEGDVIEWLVDQPADREDFRTILQVAAVVAAIVPGAQAFAPYLAVASVAYNLLVPPFRPPDPEASKSVFSVSLNGNQAKLDDAIPRTYGIDRVTPPFAAQPYYEFDANGDQYYYGVFALGCGPYDVLAEFTGQTPLSAFQDIITHAYLKPGVTPSVARANVVTSLQVAALEVTAGRYTPGAGGFVACPPNRTASQIGYDIVAPQGLGKPATEDDDSTDVTVTWRVEYQEIDEGGAPLAGWSVLDEQSLTLSTNTPVRRSYKVTLPSPMRVQVRIGRTNLKNTDPLARDGIEWSGLRAYLADAAPLNPDVSHYEIVMRASQQLSAQSQQTFNLILQGKTRQWNPTDGWNCAVGDYDNYQPTRGINDALTDMLTEPWGESLPDERIDLQTIYDLGQVWAARQDRFDYTFSSRVDAWSAGQQVASAGRARMFRRFAVRTLARDQLATLGEAAFTPRTCVAGTDMLLQSNEPKSTDPDGIVVEYLSNRTWDIAKVECPCPGVTVMQRPIYQRFDGIKGFYQAKREGLYHAADMALRRRTVTCKTAMHALVAAYLLPVRWVPQIPNYGQSGDVVDYDAESMTMRTSEPISFASGDPVYMTLRRNDGSLMAPFLVTPGPSQYEVVLSVAPDFDFNAADGTRERPVWLAGSVDETADELVKVSSIRPGGESPNGSPYFDISAVVDDPQVHTVDLSLLPGPGDVQDPIMLPGDDPSGGDGNVYIVNLSPPLTFTQLFAASFGGGTLASITFGANGLATKVDNLDLSAYNPNIAKVWMLFGEIDPSVGALYEIRFTNRPDVTPSFVVFPEAEGASQVAPNIGTLDAWQSLDTARTIGLEAEAGGYPANVIASVQIDIRRIGATALEASTVALLYNGH